MIRFHAVRSGVLRERRLVESAGVAALLLAIATAARWLLGTAADPVPFVTYFPAIVVGALLLGWKWATAMTLASGAIVRRWFLSFVPTADGVIESAPVVALFFVSCGLLKSGDHIPQDGGRVSPRPRGRKLRSAGDAGPGRWISPFQLPQRPSPAADRRCIRTANPGR